MKKTHLLLFLFFSYFVFNTGTRDCFSQTQFQLVVRDSSNSGFEARSVIQTTDGGYVAAGETGAFGDMYIVKLNSAGQLQWSKTIVGDNVSLALSVVQTSDGGFIVAGYSLSSQFFGAIVLKLTPDGIVEWTRSFPGDPAWSVVQTFDGGYAAVFSPTEGGFSPDRMIIVKLSGAGVLQWSKRFSGNSYARCIRQTTDKGYIVAGVKDSLDENMFVVKLDSNGSLQWAKTIGGTGDDFAYSVVQTIDGGYAVAGYTRSFGNWSKMYIAKLNSSGTLQWTKVIAVDGDLAYSIVQTSDGGYAVAGATRGGGAMLIIKLSFDGSLQWSRVMDGSSIDSYARAIIQTSDGGYVAAGYGGIVGTKGMFIVKLDNNGNTCGNTVSHSITVDSGGILNNHIPSVTDFLIMDTLVIPQTGSLGYVTPLCVIGIQPISNEIPATYKLYPNYPNPFNPATKIKFEISGTLVAQTFLSVYDMLGREVDVLVNTDLYPGTYEVDWDGSNYASGVYYYKLSVLNSGSSVKYQETKRMLLIK
ncbi:MAG: T9SS type A sorting domain-containing protein [Ignavibacteria bacterium]|nr:T9SS type A sorting domain-containing protein [Ignavibacteria bacterium]